MSNPYSREILAAVSTRITRERLLIANEWVRERMAGYGADAIGVSAMNLIGSPAERTWFVEHGTLLDVSRRLHDGSAEAVLAIKQPAYWLLRVMHWALANPSLSEMWLSDDLVRWEPNDPRLLAEALFSGNTVSLDILIPHLAASDPVADRMALQAGREWALAVLTVLTPVLLAYCDHPEALERQPMPRDLAVSVLSDLRVEILGDGRFDQFRDLAHRRQARARKAEGEEG